jgi:malate dehydrogenase (oxaloacetate-decarboxylating)
VNISEEEFFTGGLGGKRKMDLATRVETQRDRLIAYSPGVAQVSRGVPADASTAKTCTWAERLATL